MQDCQSRDKILSNIAEVRSQMQMALERSGRDESEVLLVGVSKTVDLPEVAVAIEAGIHDFGENRTSEFKRKQEAFPNENWHFIGRIQTNKLKDVVGRACLIHSVASLHALDTIEKLAAKLGIVQKVLIEVNVSGEESKDGFSQDELEDVLHHCEELGHVEVNGFMTMAPLGELDVARRVFRRLREIRDVFKVEFKSSVNVNLEELSMGMTQDYTEAIEEGATMIRLGRSIFA
ncbi:MAG: YggS family pyridoxal phosphate-dependent enzyme [Coriobacteriales bacterium]|jgi:pyridoxal phosphate enzyme (YggS family)